MGIINDLVELVRDVGQVKDDFKNEKFVANGKYSSISRRSMEGVMHFPVIISRSIDIETMQMISKALEKQFASFAQTAITMSPFLNVAKDKNAINYLRQFHQNTNTRNNLFDDAFNAINAMESASEDMVNGYSAVTENGETIYMIATTCEGADRSIVLANKAGLVDLMEGIRQETLNDMYVPKTKYRFKSEENLSLYGVQETTRINQKKSTNHNTDQSVHQDNRNSNMSTRADEIHNSYGDVINKVTVTGGAGLPGLTNGTKLADHQLPNNVLKDNDVKKANELVPTSMHLRVILTDEDGRPAGSMDFIAGVKATMHPIKSEEMVENLVSVIRRGGKLFKTLRWTSGEIGFAKDYVLNLTEIKDDATRQTRGNSHWWTALKRRAKLGKIKKYSLMSNDLLPNSSIVLSIDEAEHMKIKYGIDVLNPNVAYKLMKEYFLISFVVVDSAKGIAHFLFDGHTDYQDVTFTGLERGDLGGRGVDFKDVLKLVQRV